MESGLSTRPSKKNMASAARITMEEYERIKNWDFPKRQAESPCDRKRLICCEKEMDLSAAGERVSGMEQ